VVVRDSLPKTMIGKLSRKDLIAEVRAAEGW
jgi:long-chain acyl-CoA synthetase